MAGPRGVILDLDGVVYRGRQALPGSVEFLAWLRRQGIPYAFVTNNSTRTPRQYVQHLQDLGISVEEDQVVTSALCAADLLRRWELRGRVLVVGGAGLREAVQRAGYELTEEADAVAVVVGLDTDLTYARLRTACSAIRRGAHFVATNLDANLPVEGELWPGAGAIVAAVRTATGREPTSVGKPEPYPFEMALRRLGTSPEETLMVGDQIATDVLGAFRLGMRTALVLTGVASAEELERAAVRPELVARDLAELLGRLSHDP
ncbi:MAG: HAD-IIA family hydrolase [Firmicutes bacterium]|nr:HAD-IIA family hydrolase [Bacillota bacterium]